MNIISPNNTLKVYYNLDKYKYKGISRDTKTREIPKTCLFICCHCGTLIEKYPVSSSCTTQQNIV